MWGTARDYGLMLAVVLCTGAGCDRQSVKGKVQPSISVAEWAGAGNQLWMRTRSSDNALLLWPITLQQAEEFRWPKGPYDAELILGVPGPDLPLLRVTQPGDVLQKTDREEWRAWDGPMGGQMAVYAEEAGAQPFILDHFSQVVRRGSFRFATCGSDVITLRAKRSGETVAIVSVDGPPTERPGMLSGGELKYRGPFYCEFFGREDGVRLGEPIEMRLPRGVRTGVYGAWSGDSRFFVVWAREYQVLWVLQAPTRVQTPVPAGG